MLTHNVNRRLYCLSYFIVYHYDFPRNKKDERRFNRKKYSKFIKEGNGYEQIASGKVISDLHDQQALDGTGKLPPVKFTKAGPGDVYVTIVFLH
jgi:hypothetical protein